ncbi:MAG: class I SAM-dependent methyltransferase [Thermodesulfovibrionales bacterium]
MTPPADQVHCPVCELELNTGSLATILLNTPRGEQTWARCSGCKSFFALESYDSEQEAEHTRTRPWGIVESGIALNDEKSPMFEAVLRALSRFAQPGGMLLDIGCSYGGFLLQAQREGYRVRGMDIVPEAVEYVRRLGIPCDRAGSVDDLDIPANSLGIVTALDCNYYWQSQTKELRAIRSVLSPGGLLAVRTVDMSWAMQIGLWLRGWFPNTGQRLCEKAVYDHWVSVPADSLLRVVREEGFEIIYTSPHDAMPFRYNSLKVKTAYAVGQVVWRTAGYNLAPGFLFLARKRTA